MHSKPLSDPNIPDEPWQKCTLPSATVNKFQNVAAKLPGSWWTWKSVFRKHLSAFASPHTSRQVSSGQTLTNLRLDTLSLWNMPVPGQWVTGQGLTLVQEGQRVGGWDRVGGVCACTRTHSRWRTLVCVSVAHYSSYRREWHSLLISLRCYALDRCAALSQIKFELSAHTSWAAALQ